MKAARKQEEEKQEVNDRQPPTSDEDEFSFYQFSVQHFQGYMSHRHMAQRLRQPLLKHHDEGDVLVRGRGSVGETHSAASGSLTLCTCRAAGLSDGVVDHPAFHGGHAGARGPCSSSVAHPSKHASQMGEEA